jgi:hypothetical protein
MSTDKLDKRIASLSKTIESNTKLSDAVIIKRKAELQQLQQLTAAVKEYQAAEQQNVRLQNEPKAGKLEQILGLSAAYDRLAKSASQRSNRLNILTDISQNLGSRGIIGSFNELNRQIAAAKTGVDATGKSFEEGRSKLTTFAAAQTRLVGVLQIAGSSLMTIVSSLGNYAAIIGMVIGLGSLVLSFFSNASKEADRYSTAIDAAASATENIDNTLTAISKKKSEEFLSVDSIQARANAFQGLADTLDNVVSSFSKYVEAANWADFSVEWLRIRLATTSLWGATFKTCCRRAWSAAHL